MHDFRLVLFEHFFDLVFSAPDVSCGKGSHFIGPIKFHSGLRILQIHFANLAIAEFKRVKGLEALAITLWRESDQQLQLIKPIRSGLLWCNDILIFGISISFHINVMLKRSECRVLQRALHK